MEATQWQYKAIISGLRVAVAQGIDTRCESGWSGVGKMASGKRVEYDYKSTVL
jgi:hypothetical protein